MTDKHYSTAKHDVTVYPDGTPVRRVSWGAILAGTLIALMTLLLINLVLLGTGLQTIDPATEANPFSGLATGSLIGIIVADVIALFLGGWVAGRLAGNPRTLEGALHGILTWGLLTLLTFWLLSTAVGRLIGGVTSVIGQGLSAVSGGVAAVAPDAAQAVQDALQAQGVTLDNVRQEARDLVSQADILDAQDPQGQEAVLQQQAEEAAQAAEGAATDIVQDPQEAREELNRLLDQLSAEGENVADSVDRQDLVEALSGSTGLSQAEAESTVDNWLQTLQSAQGSVQQAQQELEEAAQSATDAIGSAALWTFVGLLVGAIIAAIGGAVGSPRNTVEAHRA